MSKRNIQTKEITSKKLVKKIKEEVRKIIKEENLSDEGKGFVIWILKNYFNSKGEEAVVNVIDSPNDKKVDALLEEDETIRIIQCKFFSNIDKEIGGNDVVLFKGCIDWLKNPEQIRKLNLPRLYDAGITFVEGWKEGKTIELHLFVFGRFSSGAKQEQIVFNSSDFRERGQLHFHDINDILALYRANLQERNPLAAEKAKLELIPGQYFVKEEKFPSIVATIKAKDLLKMYEKYGDSLFERNIRFYRGTRKGSINAKIIDTVVDSFERDKFWYYNNGISFVCNNFSIRETTALPILEVEGFQVINGCQTTVCLSEGKKKIGNLIEIPDEVQVVVRFIKAPVDEVDLITLYTNSQNPVSEIQLKSNCPVQKKLKEEFDNYSPPYFYSIKEGDWQKLSRNEKRSFGKRVIEMIKAAQAIYSFTADPAFARRYTIRLFSEKYYDIFRKDLRIQEILLPWRILKTIEEKIKKFRTEEFNKRKRDPSSFKEEAGQDIQRREFLLYSNLIILFFIGKLIQKRYGQYSLEIANKLLNKQLERRVSNLVDYIVSVLKVSGKLKRETNLPRYLKNFENICYLYEDIQRAIESDAARLGKNPLKDMLPEFGKGG